MVDVPGGLPPMRPDQANQPLSRAGTGPAPQTNVFNRLVVITGTGGGVFIYSPTAGRGNLVGSWTGAAGTDQFGNSYPAGINVTAGVLSGVVINALMETINPGPLIVDGLGGLTFVTFTTPGVNNWTAPAGITSVQAICWGPGGSGGAGFVGGFGGGGGGGGEVAQELTVAVTPATVYHPTVGAPGSSTTFAGDALTVTAHPGSNGTAGTASATGTGGAGGTGSTNTTHFNGGLGGSANNNPNSGGGGGGSAASQTQAGNAGQNSPSTGTGGPGGASTPGGVAGNGGAGGHGGVHAGGAGSAGSLPGGGAGGGGDGGGAAGTGANGAVTLIYSSGGLNTYFTASSFATTDAASGLPVPAGFYTREPTFGANTTFLGSNVTVSSLANTWVIGGATVDVNTVGRGLAVAEGTNAKQGTATLTAGTVTVANTSVTANSRIFLTAQTSGAGAGALRVSARTAGTSFTITSTNAADTSLVAYEIFEPG